MHNVNDIDLVISSIETNMENSSKDNRLLFFLNSKSLKRIYIKNALKRILTDFYWNEIKKHEA